MTRSADGMSIERTRRIRKRGRSPRRDPDRHRERRSAARCRARCRSRAACVGERAQHPTEEHGARDEPDRGGQHADEHALLHDRRATTANGQAERPHRRVLAAPLLDGDAGGVERDRAAPAQHRAGGDDRKPTNCSRASSKLSPIRATACVDATPSQANTRRCTRSGRAVGRVGVQRCCRAVEPERSAGASRRRRTARSGWRGCRHGRTRSRRAGTRSRPAGC